VINIRSRKLEITKKALNSNLDDEARNKLETLKKHQNHYLKKWRKAYKDFSEKHGLRIQPDRLRIAK